MKKFFKRKKRTRFWNYRVLTQLIKVDEKFESSGYWREFFVAEVFYNEDGIPESYSAKNNILSAHENVKDIIWAVKNIKKAYKKPVIDADNFPKVYKKE